MYFQIRRLGGLGHDIKYEGKIWGKIQPSREKLRKFCYLLQDAKVGKNPNFWVTSEIQRVKLGVLVTNIFGGKIWGFQINFRGKFWGQSPLPHQPIDMKVSPLDPDLRYRGECLGLMLR